MSKSKRPGPKLIRIEVNEVELSYIAEALERFIDLMPEELITDDMLDLHKRVDDRNAKAQGEPDEGY